MGTIHIGTTIRQLRMLKGLTQEDLAAGLHVSAQSVSKWETGLSNPDISYVPELARLLQVSIQELFDESMVEAAAPSYKMHRTLAGEKRLGSPLSQQEIDFLYSQTAGRRASGKRIVIVDDAPFTVGTIRTVCEAAGFDVIGDAADGVMAVEAADTLLPDVILIDLVMPVMDGFDAAKLILDAHPEIAIVACTAMPYPEIVEKSMSMGFSGFIAKPFQPAVLAERIASLLPA